MEVSAGGVCVCCLVWGDADVRLMRGDWQVHSHYQQEKMVELGELG